MKTKHENHPKVNHPGSKDQPKEVWELTDGLDPNDFGPKTFFKLHDVSNDGFLDEQELEALFTKELEKVYDPRNEDDDMVDSNKDRLVTLEEFLKATEKKEFLEPDSWETLDQQQFLTEEELKEYANLISLQENELKKKADELQKQREELQRQHDQLEAQKLEYHQVVQQMEHTKLEQEISPSGPGGHSQFEPLFLSELLAFISFQPTSGMLLTMNVTYLPGHRHPLPVLTFCARPSDGLQSSACS
ncbi:hypothetical protein HJG60_014109 [Phyllostomus discolor]|uniref:EF-hand domain-containing protein n=1 Tax=Phyllostomus discolor TaxID=89673 RepID=A0A834E2G5_9CHIR|nr:hypothetical protein HJG60_014109 [Phyllostomus discolor]